MVLQTIVQTAQVRASLCTPVMSQERSDRALTRPYNIELLRLLIAWAQLPAQQILRRHLAGGQQPFLAIPRPFRVFSFS
jgi:hypothetical protein